MKLISTCLIIVVFFGEFFSIQGAIFHVENFGAYPNDGIDDVEAIQCAINKAIESGSNNTIIFDAGVYNIATTLRVQSALNFTIKGQGMDETYLIGTQPIRIFFIQYSYDVLITSLSIDFDPLPFTAGYIVQVTDEYLDIEIQPPHHANIGQQILYMVRFDPEHMRIAFASQSYGIFQNLQENTSTTSLVSENVLRLPLVSPTEFLVGDAIIARYSHPNDAIFAYNSTDLTIHSLILYTSWSMGLVTQRIRRLNIINFHVLPRQQRWFSTSSDCMHLVSSQEFVNIIDSKCQMQGDDGANILTCYTVVSGIVNSTAIYVTTLYGTSPYAEAGCHVEFSSPQQPFTVQSSGLIQSVRYVNATTNLLIFTEPINVSINDWVINSDTPALTVRNFTVERNRARGIVLETRNIDVRDCVFNQTSAPAILIQPSLYWYEGPPARNITLANNLYINCNEGIGRMSGTIAIYPMPIQKVPVIDDILIESSTFHLGNFVTSILQSENANNLLLTGNYISVNTSLPLIYICNSRNITASNNTVVNLQSKPKKYKYYNFEQHDVCQKKLSSLIDLPNSAFNSSFLPPVAIQSNDI